MASRPVSDWFATMVPLLRVDRHRMLWRQAQERWRDLTSAVGGLRVELTPVYPGGDPAAAETYLGVPVPRAFRRQHVLGDGTSELMILPNAGGSEIDSELEDYVQHRDLNEQLAPPVRLSAELETWMAAVAAREREESRLFGPAPSHVLVCPALDDAGWLGSIVVFGERTSELRTVFTSGLSDPDRNGDKPRTWRDYELYLQVRAGSERFAANLLLWLALAVLEDGEDHLATLRSTRHILLEPQDVPGLDRPYPFLLGVRSSVPRALPIGGGATKLIPVTLLLDAEYRHAQEQGAEELAALLVEEGPGVASLADRAPVVKRGGKRGWKFW